jgi:hypothetical protein
MHFRRQGLKLTLQPGDLGLRCISRSNGLGEGRRVSVVVDSLGLRLAPGVQLGLERLCCLVRAVGRK